MTEDKKITEENKMTEDNKKMTEEEKEITIPWWFRRKAVKIAAYSAIVLVAYVVITAVFVPGAAVALDKVSSIIILYIGACKALVAWYLHRKSGEKND